MAILRSFFRTLTRNIRQRRGEKVAINIPGKYFLNYHPQDGTPSVTCEKQPVIILSNRLGAACPLST